MDSRDGGHDLPRLVLGAVLVVLGVLFTLDRLDIIDAGRLFDYWPLVLVAAGLARVLQPPGSRGRTTGAVLVVVGVVILLDNLGIIPFSIFDLWPLLLVALGAHLILRATEASRPRTGPPPPRVDDGEAGPGPAPPSPPTGTGPERVSAAAILGGVERRVTSADFRGGSLTAVMGGCVLDLRHAGIVESPAVLDVFAFWGGIEVRVPQGWQVKVEGTPIMGAIEDHTLPAGAASPALVVRGTAIMGGVEVKN